MDPKELQIFFFKQIIPEKKMQPDEGVMTTRENFLRFFPFIKILFYFFFYQAFFPS